MKSKTVLLATALCGFMFTAALGQMADTIYHGGSILTMAGKDPTYVEALAVKDGKIVFYRDYFDAQVLTAQLAG